MQYVLCIYFSYFNTLSNRFNIEEKEEMYLDFLILLGINNLRTFPYKVKNERTLRKVISDMCCENDIFLKILSERGIIMKEKKKYIRISLFY